MMDGTQAEMDGILQDFIDRNEGEAYARLAYARVEVEDQSVAAIVDHLLNQATAEDEREHYTISDACLCAARIAMLGVWEKVAGQPTGYLNQDIDLTARYLDGVIAAADRILTRDGYRSCCRMLLAMDVTLTQHETDPSLSKEPTTPPWNDSEVFGEAGNKSVSHFAWKQNLRGILTREFDLPYVKSALPPVLTEDVNSPAVRAAIVGTRQRLAKELAREFERSTLKKLLNR